MSFRDLDLNKEYGPNFSGNFDPLTRNIRTGAVTRKTHHCPECDKPPVLKCYQLSTLHLAFCTAKIQDKNGETVRCGERFQVNSPKGCAEHPYSGVSNVKFKEYLRGKELSAESKVTYKPTAEEQATAAAIAAEKKDREENRGNWQYEEEFKTRRKREAADAKQPREPTRTARMKKQPKAQTMKDILTNRNKKKA